MKRQTVGQGTPLLVRPSSSAGGAAMKHLLLICLALLAAPQAVLAKVVNVYSIANWSVVVHADDRSGRLGPCIATTKYQTGTILGFSVSPEHNGTWSILFVNPRSNL